MPKYVDADLMTAALIETKKKSTQYADVVVADYSLKLLTRTPNAIVCCKDCYKRNTSWCPNRDWTLPNDNDFCSYGEIKRGVKQ